MPESLSRRRFLQSSLAGALAGAPWGLPPGVSPADARHAVSAEKKTEVKSYPFGERRIYYNNFAEHLLNAYNPNMVYPRLRYRWTDADWRGLIDMIAGFGFNVFEFWLVPRLFSRAGIESDYGREFARQMNAVIAHAETRGVKVCLLAALTTVGDDWRTYCPNVKPEWDEVRYLWDTWTRLLPGIQLVDIFPGDPGGCSRNGCTAETYIDKSLEIAELIQRNVPRVEIQFNTWGPPFWGWGIIEGPPDWQGEFLPQYQATGWKFDPQRVEKSMRYCLQRLPDFPQGTSVFINLGFNGNGNPGGEADARAWAREIARTHRILTWDFSLTEGENAILPHYRFDRLFRRRREERDAAPYSGGICFTMTPLLNQLSLYLAARSFLDPGGDPNGYVRQFYEKLFGAPARAVADYLPLFEAVPDWGNEQALRLPRNEYHAKMVEFVDLLEGLKNQAAGDGAFHPDPETYRRELLFFAQLFSQLTTPSPDYDQLAKEYWDRVYAIYDDLPEHVDPRPKRAVANLVNYFKTLA